MSTLLREHENHVFLFAHKNCNLGVVSCDGAKLCRARGGLSHIGYFDVTLFRSIKVSGKLPTYPSPNPTFCPK